MWPRIEYPGEHTRRITEIHYGMFTSSTPGGWNLPGAYTTDQPRLSLSKRSFHVDERAAGHAYFIGSPSIGKYLFHVVIYC